MATTTFLTTWFHRRSLRHVWLIVGMVGARRLRVVAVVDRQLHAQGAPGGHAGLLGGVPRPDPAGVPDRRDRGAGPEGHALRRSRWASSDWSCRSSRCRPRPGRSSRPGPTGPSTSIAINLRENRPAVEQASARVADYFHQRGLSGAALQQETSRVLGGFATLESVAHGFRSGLRFLSLMMLGIGLAGRDRAGRVGERLARAAGRRLLMTHSHPHFAERSADERWVNPRFCATNPKKLLLALDSQRQKPRQFSA